MGETESRFTLGVHDRAGRIGQAVGSRLCRDDVRDVASPHQRRPGIAPPRASADGPVATATGSRRASGPQHCSVIEFVARNGSPTRGRNLSGGYTYRRVNRRRSHADCIRVFELPGLVRVMLRRKSSKRPNCAQKFEPNVRPGQCPSDPAALQRHRFAKFLDRRFAGHQLSDRCRVTDPVARQSMQQLRVGFQERLVVDLIRLPGPARCQLPERPGARPLSPDRKRALGGQLPDMLVMRSWSTAASALSRASLRYCSRIRSRRPRKIRQMAS